MRALKLLILMHVTCGAWQFASPRSPARCIFQKSGAAPLRASHPDRRARAPLLGIIVHKRICGWSIIPVSTPYKPSHQQATLSPRPESPGFTCIQEVKAGSSSWKNSLPALRQRSYSQFVRSQGSEPYWVAERRQLERQRLAVQMTPGCPTASVR